MDYISVKEAAEQWQVSQRCKENRIDGVLRFGHSYMIPKDLKRPVDLRYSINKPAKKE